MELISKIDGLLKKYGIKRLADYTVPTEHLDVVVFEAPSLEAFNKLGMEPEVLAMSAYAIMEVKLAINGEEVVKMLRQAK